MILRSRRPLKRQEGGGKSRLCVRTLVAPGRVSKVVMKYMKYLIVCLLAVAVLSAPQGKQTFTGTITDDECSRADHSRMRMGPTDAE